MISALSHRPLSQLASCAMMFRDNNPSIDLKVLTDRVGLEIAQGRRTPSKDPAPCPVFQMQDTREAAAAPKPDLSKESKREIMSPSNSPEAVKTFRLARKLAGWAWGVLNIRRISKAAFEGEAQTFQVRQIAARLSRRINALDRRLNERSSAAAAQVNAVAEHGRALERRFGEQISALAAKEKVLEQKLEECSAASAARTSAIVAQVSAAAEHGAALEQRLNDQVQVLAAIKRDMDLVRGQISSVRREIMFQQRRLTRLAEVTPVGSTPAQAGEAQPHPALKQRLDALYVAFEDVFRGSREDIKQRLIPYVERLTLAGAGQPDKPILDIGCGRGEWLEALRDNGLTAYGIDLNSMMVERAAALGLDAREADLLEHLRGLDDSSHSAVTAFHVVEHLPFEVLIDFLDETLRVLAPGGVLVLETPNPENIRVGATTFYNDLTHRNPIPPEPLRFIVEHRGFSDAEVLRLHPNAETLPGEGEGMARLSQLLFGPQDYAIIARRL